MVYVALSIVAVWGVLFTAAYLSRFSGGLSRTRSCIVVIAAYLVLGGLSLAWFGLDRTGLMGAFGMLLPFVAAIGMVLVLPLRKS